MQSRSRTSWLCPEQCRRFLLTGPSASLWLCRGRVSWDGVASGAALAAPADCSPDHSLSSAFVTPVPPPAVRSFPACPPPTTRGLASEHGCSAACLLWGSHTGVSGDGGFHLGPQGSGLGQSGRTGGGGGDAAWSRAGLAGPRPWGSECTWVKEPVRDDSALGCNCQTPLTLLRLYVTSG